MPDWIEPISKERAKAAKQLPAIPLCWEATTVPELPIRLPIRVNLNVTPQGIQLHAEWPDDPEFEESREEINLEFAKRDVVSVDIFLMPPIDDGRDVRYVELADYSRAVIRHRDPFEVVPYFESTFTCDNVYWLRALAKTLKERLGVKQTFSEAVRRT